MKVFIMTFIFIIFTLSEPVVFTCTPAETIDNSPLMKELDCSLSDLDLAIDILEIWNNDHNTDLVFGEKIKQLILTKVLLLRTISPDLNKIRWSRLESIYRLIAYIKNNDFSIRKIDTTCNLATRYLYSIEGDVTSILKRRKEERKEIKDKIQKKLLKFRNKL